MSTTKLSTCNLKGDSMNSQAKRAKRYATITQQIVNQQGLPPVSSPLVQRQIAQHANRESVGWDEGMRQVHQSIDRAAGVARWPFLL